RQGPAPRATPDEPCGERELADLAPRALRARKHAVEERPERTTEGELVADGLRELQPLHDLRRGTACVHTSPLLSPRQAPGAPASRPQSFGNGRARQPGKLTDAAHAELLELLATLLVEGKERQRERREELRRALVGNDQHLPGTRDARRREGGEPAPGSTRAWIPGRADGGECPLERGLETAVETLDPPRLEVETAGLDGLDG